MQSVQQILVDLLTQTRVPLEEFQMRELYTTSLEAFRDEINAIFVETSAKTGDNVQEMFTDISKRLPATTQAANPNVIIHDRSEQKKKCC
jgi:hypothetical protein